MGELTSPKVPGDICVHVTHVQVDGYRQLTIGQEVDLKCEHVLGGQDGYVYRSVRVRPR